MHTKFITKTAANGRDGSQVSFLSLPGNHLFTHSLIHTGILLVFDWPVLDLWGGGGAVVWDRGVPKEVKIVTFIILVEEM